MPSEVERVERMENELAGALKVATEEGVAACVRDLARAVVRDEIENLRASRADFMAEPSPPTIVGMRDKHGKEWTLTWRRWRRSLVEGDRSDVEVWNREWPAWAPFAPVYADQGAGAPEPEPVAEDPTFPAGLGGSEHINVTAGVKEEAVKARLVELGWTPPAEPTTEPAPADEPEGLEVVAFRQFDGGHWYYRDGHTSDPRAEHLVRAYDATTLLSEKDMEIERLREHLDRWLESAESGWMEVGRLRDRITDMVAREISSASPKPERGDAREDVLRDILHGWDPLEPPPYPKEVVEMLDRLDAADPLRAMLGEVVAR